MSQHNIRLEVMRSLEPKIDGFIEQFLIPIEEIWQPSDFLPDSQSEDFFEQTAQIRRELRKFAMTFGLLW